MATSATVESVWVYAGVAVFGVITGLDGSPLSWVAALVVLGVSLIIARTLAMIVMPAWLPYLIQMVAGSLVIYLAIASQVQSGSQGFDMGWISAVSSDSAPANYGFSVGVAVAFGALLWLLGGRLASDEDVVDHLSTNFRIGVVVLGMAGVVDAFHPADLHIFPLMFVFFGSGLVGLSLGHLLPVSSRTAKQRAWPRVIGAVVGSVMVAGLLFSLLNQWVLTLISTPVVLLMKAITWVILFVVVAPLAYIVQILIGLLFRLLARFLGEAEPFEFLGDEGFGRTLLQLGDEAAETGPSSITQVIEWTVLVVVVSVVLYFLARAFRRRTRWRRVDEDGIRESMSDNVDPAYDLARLLFNLIPSRFRRKKTEYRLRLPDDDSGIVDVFRIYFGMLMLAEDRGHPRPPNQTPTEYQSSLESVFPRNVVRMITAAFNRACYGHQPATGAEIDQMRGALERAAAESGG